jgi:hypothetical protein
MALRFIAADQVIAAAGAALACPHEAEPEIKIKRQGFLQSLIGFVRKKFGY